MTKTTPFFSVVIPTLNEEKYLPRLLGDLAKQSMRDFEVNVVDGQSTDRTLSLAEAYTNKLPHLHLFTCTHKNVSTQRNFGAVKSKGKYLVFMDADNTLPTYYLEGLHYRLLSTPTDLFTTWCTPDSSASGEKTIATAINLAAETAKLLNLDTALGALIGFKANVFRTDSGFDANMNFAEDTEIVRRYVKRGYNFSIFRDPQFCYSFRRYRAAGTIKTIQKSAVLYIKAVTGNYVNPSEYPMGGHVFVKSKRTLKDALAQIMDKLRTAIDEE